MADRGALVIPSDIASALAAAEQQFGWLGGGGLESESVFLVTSAQIGPTRIYSEHFKELFPHRCWELAGVIKDELGVWIKGSVASFDGHSFSEWFPSSELTSQLPADLLDGGSHKIGVYITEASGKGKKAHAVLLELRDGVSKTMPMDTITVNQNTNPFSRLPEEPAKRLQTKRVTIVGAGSGGGEIALNLACAGVGSLTLFDDDRLHEENYIRHALTKRELGRSKVAGLRDAIRERNLPTVVSIHAWNIVTWANEFRDSLVENRPDLILCATDSRDSRRLMNLCSIGFGIPLVIAGILDSGRIGEVMLVRPKESACYECIRMGLGAALEATGPDDRALNPYCGGEEEDLQSVALRFDVGLVSSLAARVALQILDPKSYVRLPADYLVWGREKNTEYASPFRFEYPLSLNYVPLPMRADCPACGERPADLKGVDIDARFDEIITELNSLPA